MNNLKVASKPSHLENLQVATILCFVVSVFWALSSEANSYDTEIEPAPAAVKPSKPAPAADKLSRPAPAADTPSEPAPATAKPSKSGSNTSSYDMEIEPYKPHDSSGSPKRRVTRPAISKPPSTKELRRELAKNPELGFKCISSNVVLVAELTGFDTTSVQTPSAQVPSQPGVAGRATFKPVEFLKGPDLTNPISIDYSAAPQSVKRSPKIANDKIVPTIGTKYILFLIEQEDGSWRFYQGHDTKLPHTKENLSAVERILKAAKMSRIKTKPDDR